MCKDLKNSRFERNKERTGSQKARYKKRQNIENYATATDGARFNRPSAFDIPLAKHFNTANNLKFVLYIYEVKKMKDIYGRVSTALDIVQQKRLVSIAYSFFDFLNYYYYFLKNGF